MLGGRTTLPQAPNHRQFLGRSSGILYVPGKIPNPPTLTLRPCHHHNQAHNALYVMSNPHNPRTPHLSLNSHVQTLYAFAHQPNLIPHLSSFLECCVLCNAWSVTSSHLQPQILNTLLTFLLEWKLISLGSVLPPLQPPHRVAAFFDIPHTPGQEIVKVSLLFIAASRPFSLLLPKNP